MQITIRYHFTEEYIQEQLIQTGRKPSRYAEVKAGFEDMSEDQRRALVECGVEAHTWLHIETHEVKGYEALDRSGFDPSHTYNPVPAGRPEIVSKPVEFDGEMPLAELLPAAIASRQSYVAAQAELEPHMAKYREDLEWIAEQRNAYRKAEAERMAKEQEAARQELATLDWDQDNRAAVRDFFETACAVVNAQHDDRFPGWVKRVESLDPTKANGYLFRGSWVNSHTVLERQPQLFLLCSVTGSRRYQTKRYHLIELGHDGQLHEVAQAKDAGWALALKDAAKGWFEDQSVEFSLPVSLTLNKDQLARLEKLGQERGIPEGLTPAELILHLLNG